MKSKIFKISVILVMILTMTMTNFVFVGNSLISYALDNNNNTNNSNVEFNAYFKNEKGDKVSNLDLIGNSTETMLYFYLNVKQEGYFNGSLHLEEGANFKLKEADNQYVKSVENNIIQLHDVTAGTSIEIPVKIEPVKEETYTIGLLDVESKVSINGIYKDRSEKDRKINATKAVRLKIVDGITQENIINQATIITNKIANIEGEEKRIVQLSWDIGLQENHFPIQEIVAQIKVPTIGEKEPEIGAQVALNTMTSYHYQYENEMNKITLTNQKTPEGTVTWKSEGTENIILTYIYDKNVELKNIVIQPEIKMTLYNQKEISSTSQVLFNQEEKDSVIEIETQNQESEIYKGKLMAGIDRQYLTRTSVKVNLAKIVEEIVVQEEATTYTVKETESIANSFYSQTLIAKEQFDQILGANGVITIMNSSNQLIGTIDATTAVNEKGYMVVDYGDSQTKQVKIQMTQPIKEGTLDINHIKNIKETQKQIVKEASRIHNVISCQYNKGQAHQVENTIPLKDTVTESKIAVDSQQLSTVVNNSIEMKITLLSNEEKYDLYENPNFTITLPNQIENIHITNISKLYDDNNEFGDVQYAVNGNQINLALQGKQTNYLATVDGVTLVIEAQIQVKKTSATSEEQINLTYQNDNAVSYANNAVATAPIKITAPKEITAVNRIQDLSVETIGEEETTQVMMEKGTSAKQVETEMEIINSNAVAIKDVKILGDFPTNDSQNNMGIAITGGIQVQGADQAKVYYSANEKATDDINNAENGWSEDLNGEAKTYLILLDTIHAQSNVQATYQMTIPENLAYNKVATEGYSVSATNSETGTDIELTATTIAMQTGVGPQVESKLQAVVGTDALKANDVVKNGEVIKYQVTVANTGTEEATNVTVVGNVPEGTTLVEPMNHYEYTGSAYYQEKAEQKSYTTTLEKLPAGQTETIEYEVRVNSNVQAGTKITNDIEVQYGEAKTKSSMTNVIQTSNVRVSLKRITDRRVDIYNEDYITYYAIIENMSNTEQKDVTIQTNLSNNADVDKLVLITGMQAGEITDEDLGESNIEKEVNNTNVDHDQEEEKEQEYEETDEDEEEEIVSANQQQLDYKEQVNIGNLNAGETKVLYYIIKTKSSKDTNIVTMSLIAKANAQTGRSNVWEDTVLHYNIEADMKTNTQSQFVEIGNEIDYHITVKNTNKADSRVVRIIDEIPDDLEIESITVDGKEKKIPEESNKVGISTTVKAESTMDIIIKAVVDEHQNAEAKTINNVATVEENGDVLVTTPKVSHIIKGLSTKTTPSDADEEDGDRDDNEDGDKNSTDNNNNAQDNNSNAIQATNMIAGTAWFDANANGVKDSGESVLSDIKVKLLNVETNQMVKDNNGNEITATTNSNGIYILQNIAKGKYIVIFEYDTTKYGLTTYRAGEVSESENSNAVMNELSINGVPTKVASTDIITVQDKDISNINIGLIKLDNFDLQLKKYINRILIQNASGSTVRQYGNVDMAKIELDAKKIKGSTVLIEYQIVLSNVGEVDGYVKKVVDYIPSDLKFSSELNKDWYQTNGALYNASLANDKIAAGESKTITLTLTKSMTENNTGLTRNVAEIAEDYNELGLKDSNSTPGNKANGENDMASAEVIISIRTGAIVYVSIIITMIAIGIVVTFIIVKRKKQNKKEII